MAPKPSHLPDKGEEKEGAKSSRLLDIYYSCFRCPYTTPGHVLYIVLEPHVSSSTVVARRAWLHLCQPLVSTTPSPPLASAPARLATMVLHCYCMPLHSLATATSSTSLAQRADPNQSVTLNTTLHLPHWLVSLLQPASPSYLSPFVSNCFSIPSARVQLAKRLPATLTSNGGKKSNNRGASATVSSPFSFSICLSRQGNRAR